MGYDKTILDKPPFSRLRILRQRYSYKHNVNVAKLDNHGLYFPIHKNATNSLLKTFNTHTITIKKSVLFRDYKYHKKFAFVRDPYRRLLSCYINKMHTCKAGWREGMYHAFWKYGDKFYPKMPFDEFVKSVCSIDPNDADGHFRPQHKFITNDHGKLIIDRFYKLEEVDQAFESLSNWIGLEDLKKYHLNKSAEEKEILSSYSFHKSYTPRLKNLVSSYYHEDFKMFGYEKYKDLNNY